MLNIKLTNFLDSDPLKTFLVITFGCRVNSAESNQLTELLVNQGFSFCPKNKVPGIFLINTCAVTAKGERQCLQKIRSLLKNYSTSKFLLTGCANLASF